MAENQIHSSDGGSCLEGSGSFNTASDNSQEETVCTIRKKKSRAPEKEYCNKSDLKDSLENAEIESINTVNGSNSIGDTSKTKANDSKSSTANDSKGAGKGAGQRLHQGTAASRARQGKKVIFKIAGPWFCEPSSPLPISKTVFQLYL